MSVRDETRGGSGGGTWGTITGNLPDQTDLQARLDSFQQFLYALLGA